MNTKISDAVAWTVVGPDGKTSIGGWLGMHTYEASLKWATLREGHSYAFAYPQPAALNEVSGNSGELGGDIVELPQLPPQPRQWGVMGSQPVGYTAEQMQEYARAAIAATGKQQGGEVDDAI